MHWSMPCILSYTFRLELVELLDVELLLDETVFDDELLDELLTVLDDDELELADCELIAELLDDWLLSVLVLELLPELLDDLVLCELLLDSSSSCRPRMLIE